MREKFNHLYLDSHERKLLIHSLVCGDKGKSGTGILF
jgi:hypothetical protein